MFNKNFETFIIYIVFFNQAFNFIHLDKKTLIAFLIADEVKILNKYFDFANVFSEEKTMMLTEQTKLNKYAIILKEGK